LSPATAGIEREGENGTRLSIPYRISSYSQKMHHRVRYKSRTALTGTRQAETATRTAKSDV